MTASDTPVLEAALACVDRGCFVIPLCWPDRQGRCACPKHHTDIKEIGKAPLLGNGYQANRWTHDEVTRFWARYPEANYGILLQPSGLFILDADSAEADREVERLGVPPGPRVRRGDHTHRYLSNRQGIHGRAIHTGQSGKIDILTDGYIVGPGSLHRSGSRYVEEVSFAEAELEDPPRWATDRLRQGMNGQGKTEEIPDDLLAVDVHALRVPRWIKAVIRCGPATDPARYPSRSEAVFAVLLALIEAGYSATAVLASILLDPRNTISEKPREQGQRWVASEIARAKAKVEQSTGGVPEQKPQRDGLALTKLSDVTPQPVRWLWRGRIPLGKVTVVDGDPGLGKSLLSLDLAARISPLRIMPDGVDSQLDAQAGVVLLSAEDDLADTIRPRLEAAGADLSRVIALTAIREGEDERLPTLLDLEAIRQAITHVNAKLVIIDPLMAYLPPKVDSHRDQDIRRSLAPLAALAAETGVAVLVIRHLNKNGSGNALYRGGGSIGIIGAARSGLLVAKDPEDEDRRILAVTKSNLAKTPPALAYRITVAADEVPYLSWEGVTDHTANSLLAAQVDGEDRSALEEAKDFLRETLAAPRPAKEVQREAEQAGIAERTLRRARAALGVKPVKTGRPGDEKQQWFWSLPPKMAKSAEDSQQKTVATFGSLKPAR